VGIEAGVARTPALEVTGPIVVEAGVATLRAVVASLRAVVASLRAFGAIKVSSAPIAGRCSIVAGPVSPRIKARSRCALIVARTERAPDRSYGHVAPSSDCFRHLGPVGPS
jgi:hypothetical protein